jgi:hypothetical protein
VFYVTDQHGNKLSEDDVAERIQQVDLLNCPPFVTRIGNQNHFHYTFVVNVESQMEPGFVSHYKRL